MPPNALLSINGNHITVTTTSYVATAFTATISNIIICDWI